MGESINWKTELPGLEALENEPMSAHTTFKIGGPARWFLKPKDTDEVAAVLKLCKARGVTPFFLGKGSNLLVRDRGYDGVVVSTAGMDCTVTVAGENTIYADSGVSLARLAALAADAGLSGLEFASGIPGSVGGGLRMNAGAYGGELCQVVERVDYLDEDGELHVLPGAECHFSYRHSLFCRQPWLITGALFRLTPGDPVEIRGKMAELNRRRRDKQPLDYPSAGSTFKRPQAYFAAALIEECGLKGLRVGDAQVSEKHSGFVVNVGSATAADVLELMDKVRKTVFEKTGVTLEPEVEILA